jgi:tetratricopeptide (TPR) repeat protein
MGQLTARLIRAISAWDRSAQLASLIALTLLAVVLLVAALGPADLRQPALIGVGGLLIAIQISIMWGNRSLVTTYTQAQRAYLDGDFQTTLQLMEAVRLAGKADFRDLTLLGNTYRQIGELERSDEVLTEALRFRPNHHFPLYGFGRTLLVQGRYPEAANVFVRALDAGAPLVIKIDLADAYFRQGAWQEARRVLEGMTPLNVEPHRQLVIVYIRYRLGGGEQPSPALLEAGLSYWQAEAERYGRTDYGRALARDVRQMQSLGGGRADV